MNIDVKRNPRVRSLSDLAKWTQQELTTVRNRIDTRFRANERRLFTTEGSSGGERWERNREPYRTRKRKLGKRKVLQFSGDLRRGLTQKSHPDHIAEAGVVPAGPFVKVGTRNRVGAYHAPAEGNRLRNRSLPVRDPLQMTREQGRGLVEVWTEYIVKTKLPRIFRVLQAAARTRG